MGTRQESRPRSRIPQLAERLDLYLNRELTVLQFNRRVLAQAENPECPLLERLRFLCIVSSNLDEFFEVRVAYLQAEKGNSIALVPTDDVSPNATYLQILTEVQQIVACQYDLLNKEVLPGLQAAGVGLVSHPELSVAQTRWIKKYFLKHVLPLLSPIKLDSSHPFPLVLNKSLNFAVELHGKDAFGRNAGLAIVQVPRVLPRVIRLPRTIFTAKYPFMLLSSIMQRHIGEVFLGMTVNSCCQFRLTRSSYLSINNSNNKDLRLALLEQLPHRNYGKSVRLEVGQDCSKKVIAFLLHQFKLHPKDHYRVDGPVNLSRLTSVVDCAEMPKLKYLPFQPNLQVIPKDMFASIRKADWLLHHPYESFQPVVAFLRQAAVDPLVVVIKMTIYRTGKDSSLMKELIAAAQNGKEVTVVLELTARFDEEANINWAQRLDDAGVRIMYGVADHKIHAKMLMVVRREETGLRRYVHLSTGNYHSGTALLYTDFGLFTAHPGICTDVEKLFIQVTGLGHIKRLKHMFHSPFALHRKMMLAINKEAAHARAGRKSRIIIKVNSLLEPNIITALYRASQAGADIDLIVRGACTLRPGVTGISDNIRVRSIIGRFLEHTRVFYFYNDGADDLYLSSADWTDRNFFDRLEICFPILDKKLKKRVMREGLRFFLDDNQEAWLMDNTGQYARSTARRAKPLSAQQFLLKTYRM